MTSDVAYVSWQKISELQKTLVSDSCSESVEFKEFELEKFIVVAFVSSATPQFLRDNGNLVSSDGFDDFKFLCSKTNTSFRINEAAKSMFLSNHSQLSTLREKVIKHGKLVFAELFNKCSIFSQYLPNLQIVASAKSTPYILTGSGMGGSVAALFTLWLLDSLDPTATKRPLCITFGSPLVGDHRFQQAVSQYSTWNSCFLQVVHKDDNSPNLFDSKFYCPFGTYLFCSESGSACFEASASASVVLKKMAEDNHGRGGGVQGYDYGPVIDCLRSKDLIFEDTEKQTKGGGGVGLLKIGIEAQLAAIGFQV